MKKLKVKQFVTYGGHNLNSNGIVNLTLRAPYSELVNSISVMQMLNNDVTIIARKNGKETLKLGMFRIKDIRIDGDGESIIKFNGSIDYIEIDNLNQLPLNDNDIKEFSVLYKTEIELEDGEENDE